MEFCSSEFICLKSDSFLTKFNSFFLLYGRKLIALSPFDSHVTLFNKLLTGEQFASKKNYSRILKFLKHVHARNILELDLSWEKDSSRKKAVLKVLAESENILVSSGSSNHELLLAYLNYCHYEKELTVFSIFHEMHYLQYFYNWCNSFSLSTFTKPLVKSYLDSLKDKGLKSSSIYHHLNTVKYFADFLVEHELILSNPARSLSLKAKERKPKDVLSIKERDSLIIEPLKQLKEKGISLNDNSKVSFYAIRDSCILYLFATTGIRLLEISALKTTDVNLDERIISIHGKGSKAFSEKERTIFLEDDTYNCLKLYLERRSDLACPWLFITLNGFKLASHNFQTVVRKYGKQAGINRNVNPTLLRASFASWMIEKGIDPVALKELLGHESIRTTFGYYVFMKREHVRKTWTRCNPLLKILSELKE